MVQNGKKPELKSYYLSSINLYMSNKTHHLQIHENYPGFSNFWKRKMRSTAQLDYGNATVARRVQGLRGKCCGHLTLS